MPTLSWSPGEVLRLSLTWIEQLGMLSGLVFIGIYILATVAFLPGSVLTLGSGVVFGVVLGSLYVLIGATLGAIAAFLIGRYLARDWITRKIGGNPRFKAIDQAVGQAGLKIVFLTRLSPLFPFGLLNYAFGVTNVSLRDYALGSLGMIPVTVMYVYIGSLASSLARVGTESQPGNLAITWVLRILGLVAAIAVTIYITRLAKTALATEVSNLES